MLDRPSALHAIGLSQEGGLLKGAYLTLHRGKPVLKEIFEMELSPAKESSGEVKPLYTRKEGRALQEIIDKSIVITGLDAQEVLTRNLQLDLTKDRDIEAVLTFQAEPLLPYPAEEAVIDWVKHSQNKEGTSISLLAAKNETIERHLDRWLSMAIEPEMISCIPAALASFSKYFTAADLPHFVVDIGLGSTSCIVAEGGKLLATQSSLKGVHHLFEAFTLDQPDASIELFYSLDFSRVEEVLQPNLYRALTRLKTEVAKTLFSLGNQVKGEPINDVLITGVGGVIRSLATAICKDLKLNLLIPEEQSTFSLPPSQLQRYAIPIGYALSGLPSNGTPINFRQGAYTYPDPWKRTRKPLIAYFSTMLGLTLALLFYTHFSVAKQDDQIKQEYARTLEILQKPYSEVEKEFSTKTGLPGGIPLKELSEAELSLRIQFINKELASYPDIFPLQPNIPTVSDLLAWLSTHPQIIGEGETKEPRIQLESVNYKIVKRPEKNKMREKYQAKVELEISTSVPRYAREFYDSLLVPNDLIDPSIEVKWNASREKYKATFFLKDRTVYP